MNTADFLVVGGGIAGASAAYELAAHGRVVLLEREPQCGYHTTGRSAALFTEAWETPTIRSIVAAGRSFFEEPPDGFTAVPLVAPRRILLIGRPDQRGAVEAAAADARTEIPSVRMIDGQEALELCPALRPDYLDVAVLESGGYTIDVDALLQGFLRGVRRRHGEVVTGAPVIGIERLDSGWNVTAGEQRFAARVLINAAGAWSDQIAGLAGVQPVGLTPLRRTAFTFSGPSNHDVRQWPAVIDIDEQFYFEPEGPQLLGSPADETPTHPHDVRAEEIDVAIAIERIQAATTIEIRHVRRAWAGLRTFAPDRLPVVGPDPDVPDFIWLAGQGGFGIMTSPAMARIAMSMAIGAGFPLGLPAHLEAAIRPERLRT
ncbi:MAG: FAD-dependent oxidoreductase [Acidimicrobiia bacterium]|nr:FAD-dependent oxidoreductase [Acidimicrobiia bacterium]